MMINDETINVIKTGSRSLNDTKSSVVNNSSITTDTEYDGKPLKKTLKHLLTASLTHSFCAGRSRSDKGHITTSALNKQIKARVWSSLRWLCLDHTVVSYTGKTEGSVITNCVVGHRGAAVRPLVVCFGHSMYSRVLSSKPFKSEAALNNTCTYQSVPTAQRTRHINMTGLFILFCTMTNQSTITWQIITVLHVSTILCNPQGDRS